MQNTKNDFEKAEAHYKRSLEVYGICVAPRHASLFIQVDGNRVATLCNYAALMKVMGLWLL